MKEKLSAFVDGELEPAELQDMMGHAPRDSGLGKIWARYHLIRDVIRNDLGALAAPGMVEGVSQQLAQEPTVLVPRTRSKTRSRITRMVTGMALVASVAAVALIGVRMLNPVESTESQQFAQRIEPEKFIRTGTTRWTSVPEDVENNLNLYLVQHSEFTPVSNMNGVISYVHFVSYDSER